MVEDPLNEDQWLYGDSNDGNDQINGGTDGQAPPELPSTEPPQPEEEDAEQRETDEQNDADQDGFPQNEASDMTADIRPPGEELEEGEDDDSDDSDDNVQVTIGDIKAAPQYGNLNIKRNTLINTGIEKQQRLAAGKFSIDDFESIGTINGVPVHEYSIDALEDKPWRKPGADITDYFNYGFNEETWRAYCERQKTMRVRESGVGLGGLGMTRNTTTVFTAEGVKHGPVPVVVGRKVGGPPPEPRRAGIIEVIGSSAVASRRANEVAEEENAIQVLTADKRDYGRKVSGYDMSVPPPNFDPTIPPVVNYGGYPSQQEFYTPEMPDPYYQHYDRSAPNMSWLPPEKPETSLPEGVAIKQEPADKPPKERERDRDYDRHKERSRRHRSRSRSGDRRRKHKSRSRSPHRSHKKKKSKKSDRDRSRERDRSRSRERSRERDRSRDRERSHTRDQERSHTRDREPSED